MATVLTLHKGAAEQAFVEHPTEVARKAMQAAAEVESEQWADLLRAVAAGLPCRAPLRNGETTPQDQPPVKWTSPTRQLRQAEVVAVRAVASEHLNQGDRLPRESAVRTELFQRGARLAMWAFDNQPRGGA